MTKKVTISVPDELHERMEKVRDSVNFSKVCQMALADKVSQVEHVEKILKGDADKMEQAIERLRREKQELESYWTKQGEKDGLFWAKDASYGELKHVVRFKEESEYQHDPALIDRSDEIFVDWLEAYIETQAEDLNDEDVWESWNLGFQDGVQAFWDKVKKELEEKQDMGLPIVKAIHESPEALQAYVDATTPSFPPKLSGWPKKTKKGKKKGGKNA